MQPYFNINKTLAYVAYCIKGVPQKENLIDHIRRKPDDLASVIRRYDGWHKGNIIEYSHKLIDYFNYTGFIELEYIVNKKNNSIYFMECNPRPWGTIDYMRYATDNKNTTIINLHREMYYFLKYRPDLLLKNLYKIPRYLFYSKINWSWRDPLPFLGQIFNAL